MFKITLHVKFTIALLCHSLHPCTVVTIESALFCLLYRIVCFSCYDLEELCGNRFDSHFQLPLWVDINVTVLNGHMAPCHVERGPLYWIQATSSHRSLIRCHQLILYCCTKCRDGTCDFLPWTSLRGIDTRRWETDFVVLIPTLLSGCELDERIDSCLSSASILSSNFHKENDFFFFWSTEHVQVTHGITKSTMTLLCLPVFLSFTAPTRTVSLSQALRCLAVMLKRCPLFWPKFSHVFVMTTCW